MISTVYTTLFAVAWYVYEPHDGRRVANSDAQREMMEEAGKVVDEVARKAAAQAIWKSERGFAAAVIVLGWMVKVGSPSLRRLAQADPADSVGVLHPLPLLFCAPPPTRNVPLPPPLPPHLLSSRPHLNKRWRAIFSPPRSLRRDGRRNRDDARPDVVGGRGISCGVRAGGRGGEPY